MAIDTIIYIGGKGYFENYIADSSIEDVDTMAARLEAESSAAHADAIGEEWGGTRQMVDVVTYTNAGDFDNIEDADDAELAELGDFLSDPSLGGEERVRIRLAGKTSLELRTLSARAHNPDQNISLPLRRLVGEAHFARMETE